MYQHVCFIYKYSSIQCINLFVYKTSPRYSCLTLLKNACILTYDNSEILFPPAINYGVTVKK